MPIWGTCLGFQHMLKFVAGSVITQHEAKKLNEKLTFIVEAADSKLYSELGDGISAFEDNNITYNYHKYGIGIDGFNSKARCPASCRW